MGDGHAKSFNPRSLIPVLACRKKGNVLVIPSTWDLGIVLLTTTSWRGPSGLALEKHYLAGSNDDMNLQ